MRAFVAAAAALAMLLTSTAQPARANVDGISSPIVDASLIAWNMYRTGTATPEQILEFVRLVTGALDGLENEVIEHADGIEAAEVLGQAASIHADMLDYHNFRDNEILLWNFAMRASDFAHNAAAKYGAVGRKAKDQIGLGAQTLFPITLAARVDVGATGGLSQIEATYRELNQKIVTDLEPTCTRWTDPEPVWNQILVRHTCKAANGEEAIAIDHKVGDTWYSGPVNVENLKLEAAKNSSWAAAKRILAGQGQ